ncbi:UNVERIFIED_CONTAM: hypothetical protein FKN15_013665 [Acipenser sinensis]
MRTSTVHPGASRQGWDASSSRGRPQSDRPPRTQTTTLPSMAPVYVPPPSLFPPPSHTLPLPPGVPLPQFPPLFQPPTTGYSVPPPLFPPASTTVAAPWVPTVTTVAQGSAIPTIPQAPPLSREEFYRQQRRLKEEEKSKLDEFTNDFAKELLEYRKIQKERRRSYSRQVFVSDSF